MQTTKKAFTLPGLLIAVVLMGLAAAIVLPPVYGAWERRLAEEVQTVLAQYRTEQENRCVRDGQYSMDAASLPGILSRRADKHFTYVLLATGVEARRSGGYGYVLRMPSYEDGRLCCETPEACQRLGKEYPSCTDLTARADYHSGEECSAVKKEPQCIGESTRPCGCQEKGQQTRTCDPQTDTWSEWGACSIPLTCDCSAVSGPRPAPQEQPCPQGGTQSRGFSCDTLTGQWIADPWGDCKPSADEAASASASAAPPPALPAPADTPEPAALPASATAVPPAPETDAPPAEAAAGSSAPEDVVPSAPAAPAVPVPPPAVQVPQDASSDTISTAL